MGGQSATWTLDGDTILITPRGGATLELRWRRSASGLELALDQWERFYLAKPGPLDGEAHRPAFDDPAMLAVLAQHVNTAIDFAEARGIRVFLLGYPFAMPAHEQLVNSIAERRAVPFLSMVEAFDARLTTDPHSVWFTDPIHCTARGYELMAEIAGSRLA